MYSLSNLHFKLCFRKYFEFTFFVFYPQEFKESTIAVVYLQNVKVPQRFWKNTSLKRNVFGIYFITLWNIFNNLYFDLRGIKFTAYFKTPQKTEYF